jgi:hypothetical protein
MSTIDATDARLSTHEEVCALRYEKINETLEIGEKRMTKIEYLLYAVMAVVLLGPGVGAEFFKKIIGL